MSKITDSINTIVDREVMFCVHQERQRIAKEVEEKKKSPVTEPDKPKRGRPRKYPQATFKTTYPTNDAYNQALEDVLSIIKGGEDEKRI